MMTRSLIPRSMALILGVILFLTGCQRDTISDQWLDQSPHKTGFMPVNGITLHYLDWGGSGEVMLFLAGYSNSAHIFDEFAPRFTEKYRVLGLTRRGHGQSDAPPDGYDTGTLMEDIVAFLDQLEVKKAILIGHSFAGSEMTRLANTYPDRITSLVYLDAGFDYINYMEEIATKSPKEMAITAEDEVSRESLNAWVTQFVGLHAKALTWELHNTGQLKPDSAVHDYNLDLVSGQIFEGLIGANPVYTSIVAPVLSIYGLGHGGFADADSAAVIKIKRYTTNVVDPWKLKNHERMKSEVKNIKTAILDSTHHYMFLQRPERVEREIRAFLE